MLGRYNRGVARSFNGLLHTGRFGTRLSPLSRGTWCYLSVRAGHSRGWRRGRDTDGHQPTYWFHCEKFESPRIQGKVQLLRPDLIRDWRQGRSFVDIGSDYGIHRNSVYRVVVPHLTPDEQASLHPVKPKPAPKSPFQNRYSDPNAYLLARFKITVKEFEERIRKTSMTATGQSLNCSRDVIKALCKLLKVPIPPRGRRKGHK